MVPLPLLDAAHVDIVQEEWSINKVRSKTIARGGLAPLVLPLTEVKSDVGPRCCSNELCSALSIHE
jgi:hypothetical protein